MGGESVKTIKDLYKEAESISSRLLIQNKIINDGIAKYKIEDNIDADSHETFTLEDIKSLIIKYRKKDKDFILARVTTPDPENPEQTYDFYYAAAELNRVLFKYESTRRLLHRMKVKNPLNNMYIIGEVYYYRISTNSVDSSILQYYLGKEKDKYVEKHRNKEDDLEQENKENLLVYSPVNYSYRDVINDLEKGKIKIEKIPKEKKIEYIGSYIANDEDFLTNINVREYFRRNTLEENDDFLYEIDRPQTDFMILIDEGSNDIEEEVSDWRRIFSAHISLAISILFLCLLMGGGPGAIIIFLPLAVIIFISFICSLFYVLFCRRTSFDTLAVNSIEEEI